MCKVVNRELTDKQQETYDYLVGYIQMNLFAPSITEICKRFGISIMATVNRLKILQKKGYIEIPYAQARAIKLIGYKIVKEEKEND